MRKNACGRHQPAATTIAKTWKIQTRMVECLKLQQSVLHHPRAREPTIRIPTRVLVEDMGHAMDPTAPRHRYECIRCGQGWPRASHRDISLRGPCPGIAAIYGPPPSKERPWKILSPTVTVGSDTHPSHGGSLYWIKGVLFCMRCGHCTLMPGGRLRGPKEPCQVKSEKDRKALLDRMGIKQEPPRHMRT